MLRSTWVSAAIAVAVAGVLAACEDADPVAERRAAQDAFRSNAHAIRAAGASFPYPVYARWAAAYSQETGIRLEYERSGSEAGVEAVKAGEVDFGASDIPLAADELARAGLVQFPLVIGAVVPVVNLPGVGPGDLHLTADALAGIYLGKIARWNDPALVALNPKLPLPDREITPIHRSDSSGTTWLFTHYLTRASPAWRAGAGAGGRISWPVGVGAEDNDQVTRFIHRFDFTLGYVEIADVGSAGLSWVTLRNRAGELVAPGATAVAAAVVGASWQPPPEMRLTACDRDAPGAWPITGASYGLLQRDQKNPRRAKEILRFLNWALTEGGAIATELNHVPVPAEQVAIIDAQWTKKIRAADAPVWP